MAVVSSTSDNISTESRQSLTRRMQEIDAQFGVIDDPTMTIEKLREMMHDLGIRPEDNGASREMLRIRYGDDADRV